jgi:hypothetical protein
MKKLGVTDEDLINLLAIVDPAKNITTEWSANLAYHSECMFFYF